MEQDRTLIRKIGAEGMVLLKNQDVLPLKKEKLKFEYYDLNTPEGKMILKYIFPSGVFKS